jgi:hypothetical protein
MADILKDYPAKSGANGNRATCGGVCEPKPLPYSPPVGPKNHMSPGPGLRGGTNHGNAGTQAKR